MPIAVIQPADIQLPDPSGGDGGWSYGIPTNMTAADGYGFTAVNGVRSSCQDIFGDSPPIGDELYLITALSIGYGALLHNTTSAPAPAGIQVELAIMIGTDVRVRIPDTQPSIETGEVTTYISTGVFSADLINPILVSSSETVKIRIGQNGIGSGGSMLLAGQYTGNETFTKAIPYPSVISYQELTPKG